MATTAMSSISGGNSSNYTDILCIIEYLSQPDSPKPKGVRCKQHVLNAGSHSLMIFDVIIHCVSVNEYCYTRRGGLDDRPVFCEPCQFFTDTPLPHNNKTPRLIIQARRRPGTGLDDLHQLLSLDRLVGIPSNAPSGINSFKQIHYCLPPSRDIPAYS